MIKKNYFISTTIFCIFTLMVLCIQCNDNPDYSNLSGNWSFKMENIELGYWQHSGELYVNGSFSIYHQSEKSFSGAGVLEFDPQTNLDFEINCVINENDDITMQWIFEDAFNSEQICIWFLNHFTLSDNTMNGTSNIYCVLNGSAGITATKKQAMFSD